MTFETFFTKFRESPEWATMEKTVEASPWHRESNVAVHTVMVLDQYHTHFEAKRTEAENLVALVALLFHDVGKPAAEETLEKKDGSGELYRRYAGHEQDSAVQFQEFYVNSRELREMLTPLQARAVRWIIEHHLPYGLKDVNKRKGLAQATFRTLEEAGVGYETFFDCLRSDSAGRISDDHTTKLQNVEEWIAAFKTVPTERTEVQSAGRVVLLVGPSGSGKTTYIRSARKDGDLVLSMDELKLEYFDAFLASTFVSSEDEAEYYAAAWEFANTNDAAFRKFALECAKETMALVKKAESTLFVDITNLSKKARGTWVAMAQQSKLKVEAVEFWNSFQTLMDRQKTRGDKSVPYKVVQQQVQAQSCVWLGLEANKVSLIVG